MNLSVIVHYALWFAGSALAFGAVSAAILSHFRFEQLQDAADKALKAGVGTAEDFKTALIRRLGWNNAAKEVFTVMTVRHGAVGELATFLKNNLRKDDVVFQAEEEVWVVLRCPREAVGVVHARLEALWKTQGTGKLPPTYGSATYPMDGRSADALCSAAHQALDGVQAGGMALAQASAPVGGEAVAAKPGDLLDPLTGVIRESRVLGFMSRYVGQILYKSLPVSFLYVSVDRLVQYQSQYGRAAVDAILKELGQWLQKAVREADYPARIQGDDFIVALACTPHMAEAVAARLLALARKNTIPFGPAPLKITLCMGLAGYPLHRGSARELIEMAELAHRVARQRGGNQSALYDLADLPAPQVQAQHDVFNHEKYSQTWREC